MGEAVKGQGSHKEGEAAKGQSLHKEGGLSGVDSWLTGGRGRGVKVTGPGGGNVWAAWKNTGKEEFHLRYITFRDESK